MEIGLIGLGDMGLMYAKRIVKAGWKKHYWRVRLLHVDLIYCAGT